MPRFAANISLMYPELPLLERVAAAARDGFTAVEVQAPYQVPAEEFRRALNDARVQLVLMNAPMALSANPIGAATGFAAMAAYQQEFEQSIQQALDYARVVKSPRIHVMAGTPDPQLSAQDCLRSYLCSLAFACDLLRPHGMGVTIEPLNQRDFPGYYLRTTQQAAEVIAALHKDNLGLQLDFYHLQISEGDLARRLERCFPLVTHVQIAGVPERHEPDVGEINYPYLMRLLDKLNYRGWVGCEYRPMQPQAGGTSAGLGWLRRI